MNPSEVLRRITAALDRAGIAYMLTGSFASSMYGALRSTMDIDIVIAASRDQVERLVQLLPETEYYVELESALRAYDHESMFNVIDLANKLEGGHHFSKIPRVQPGGVQTPALNECGCHSSVCSQC